jgi:DNA-binding NtrC family response regulator
MPVLFAFREGRFGFKYQVVDRAVLGRGPECQLILFDRGTSRTHAEIFRSETDEFILKDLGSTNGTFHNEVQVKGELTLQKNDQIRVGQEIFLFDPDLDVSVGPDGVVFIVGDVEAQPEGRCVGASDLDLAGLDRTCLAHLFQVATALANRPKQKRVLKQAAYALNKLFGASSVVLLWPETVDSERLTALLCRPSERRLALPRPMVDQVLIENRCVIWPNAIVEFDFQNGKRYVATAEYSTMAVPLKAHGDLLGFLYVESNSRVYTNRDLNFLNALGGLIASALVNASLIGQLEFRLAREEEDVSTGGDFIGDDNQIKALLGTAYQVGLTEARLLLNGEVGTGKEVLARRIHSFSPRRRGPYISVNCSAHAPGQIERVLFGQEEGAGTEEGTPGALEQADGGTIFIRHVDHLALSAQVELLRTIEEGIVYRVGSPTPRPVNCRIISSTTLDLDELAAQGEFREDLAQRLAEVVLTMPPLRELKNDVVTLAKHFFNRSAKEMGIPVPDLDGAAADCLRSYPWPGNVGELKNLAQQLIMFAQGSRVVLDDLTLDVRLAHEALQLGNGDSKSESLNEVERILIRRALARSNGKIATAAELLGLGESDLEAKMEFHQIGLN